MKNATQIITSLQNRPQFSKLSSYKCIDKVLSMFMPTFTKFVKFSYFKNDTLFFVLNHNAGKQEFDNNVENIKSALNFFMPPECKEKNLKDIKAFVTHTPSKKKAKKKLQPRYYMERATGKIKVDVKDPKLHSILTTIQEIIQEKNDT